MLSINTVTQSSIREIVVFVSSTHNHSLCQSNMWLTLVLPGAVTLLVLWITVIKFLSNRKVQNLHTKYVFITGCDSGFGRETAIRLDKMGVNVLATCLTKQGEQDLKSMTSNRLKTFQMDVTDSQQIKDVFEQVKNMLPSGQGKDIDNHYVEDASFTKHDNAQIATAACTEQKAISQLIFFKFVL